MKTIATAGLLLAALVTLQGLAAGAYGPGSTLESDVPVALEGRIDALVPKGIVSLVGERGDASDALTISAARLQGRAVTVPPRCPTYGTVGGPCTPNLGPPRAETVPLDLENAKVTVTKVLGTYQIVATNDAEAYGAGASFGSSGALLATPSSGAQLTANPTSLYLSPYGKGWVDREPTDAPTFDIYTAERMSGLVHSDAGGNVRGAGGFQVLLQGVQVRITGTTPDGDAFDQTFDTPYPEDDRSPTRFLDLQATGGILNVLSKGRLDAHGVSLVDATGAATLPKATGRVEMDGDTQEYAREDARLAGPVALTLLKVVDGNPLRLSLALSSVLTIRNELPPPEDEEKETDTVALVAAGVAGASGASLLAAMAYFWPRLKFGATLLFLPLYSRIERTAVLEHEKRDEIYGLIRATPGIHAHEIGQKANIGWGTTVYHLKLLENHNLVVSQKSGRYKRFFVNTGEFTKKKDAYGALRNDTAKAVAQYIVNHPGVTQKELCAALGIQPSLASWHVEKLEGVELVKRVKDGRQVRYFAGPAWAALNVRIDPRGGGEGLAET